MAATAIYKLVAELKADASDFQREFEKVNQTAEKTKLNMEQVAESVNKISIKLMAAGGVMTAGSGVLIKGAAEWERGFADLHSVLDMNAEQMERLKTLAVDFSNDHKVASDSIINSYYNMASAGMNFNEIMASTADVGTLAIAAAQPLQDMSSAMDDSVNIFTDAMNVYRDEFDSLGYSLEERSETIMNTIAGSVQAFKTTLPEMRAALKNVAGDAANAGVGFEELNASLGILMTNGKRAEEAGTGLRSMLVRLQTTAADFGINVYDANGSLKDLSIIMSDVKEYMDGFSSQTEKAQAMTKLFGMEQQGIAKILMANVDNLEKQTQALKESSSALEMAAYREADLGSQLQILKNNFQNLGASLGEFLLPMMHEITEALKGFSQWLQGLSPEMQEFIAKIAGIGGPALLAAGGIGKLVANMMSLKGVFGTIAKGGLKVGGMFADMAKSVYAMGKVSSDAGRMMGELSSSSVGGFGKITNAVKTSLNGLKAFNAIHPKISSAIGWTGLLVAGLTAINAALKPINEEVKKLYDEMNEFGDLEVETTFWNSLPFIGDTIKSRDYAKVMKEYVDELQNMGNEVTGIYSELAGMSKEGFEDESRFNELKSQAKEFIDFLDEAKKKAESQGKTLEEYFPSGLGEQYKNIAEQLQAWIAEGEEALGVQEDLKLSTVDLGTSLTDLEEALKKTENIGQMDKTSLEDYKKELQALIQEFGKESEQGQQLADTLSKVENKLNDLTAAERKAKEEAEALRKQQESLDATLDNYRQNLSEIAVKGDLFKLDEWQMMEQVVASQKAALEQLATQYVNGEISAEHYKAAVDKLLPSYEKNKKAIEDHNKALEKQKEKEEELAKSLEAQKEARESFNDIYDSLNERTQQRIESARLEGKEIEELTAKREASQEALKEMLSLTDDMGELSEEEKQRIADLKTEIQELIAEEERRARMLKEHEAAMDDLNQSYEAQAGSIQTLQDAISGFDGSTNAYEQQAQAMAQSLETLKGQLESYKKKMEELEALKGTDAFDPELYEQVKQGMNETGEAINNLENEFKDLAAVSDGFAGVFDGLDLSLKKTALEFDIFGDKLEKLKTDASSYKKAIDDLLNIKAVNPDNWTAENEAELQRLVEKYQDLTREIGELEKARASEEEAAKRQLEAEKAAADFLNEIRLAEEKLLDSGNVEEYLNDMISLYQSKKDELLKAIAMGEEVEKNRKELEAINAILGDYSEQLDDVVKAKENAAKATDAYNKSMENLNETLNEGGKHTLEQVKKEIEAYEQAISATEEHLGSLTAEQIKALEEWKKKLKELYKEAENLEIPFQNLEDIQEKIGDIEISISMTDDIDEQLELTKEKLQLLSEEAQIIPNLAIEQDEIDGMLNDIKKEYDATYDDLLKITEKGAQAQVDKIKEIYGDVAPTVVKHLKKLTKDYEKEFLNGLMDEKQYKIAINNVNEAIKEATEKSLEEYQAMMSQYEDEPTIFEMIAEKSKEHQAYIDEMYEAGLISLEEYHEARQKIIKGAEEDEEKALEELRKNYINSLTGNEGELAKALETAKEHYNNQVKLIEQLADKYGEVWAEQEKNRAYQNFLDSQSEAFEDFFHSQIEGYETLADETADIFERADLLEKFKEQYGTIEKFREEMTKKINEMALLGEWDEEQIKAAFSKLDQLYLDFKNNVEEDKIKIQVDAAEFAKGLNEFASQLEQFASLATQIGDLFGGVFGDIAKEAGVAASAIADGVKGAANIGLGYANQDYLQMAQGIIQVTKAVIDLTGAIKDMMNTEAEHKSDLSWANDQSISDALDVQKWRDQANLNWSDDIHVGGLFHSAGHERFEAMVRDTVENRIDPMIDSVRKLREEYEKIGEEAKETGMESIAKYYDIAGEKLEAYADKLEEYRDVIWNVAQEGGPSEELEQDIIGAYGQKIEEYQKKVQQVATLTESLTDAFQTLEQQDLADSGLGQMLDDLAEKAIVKLENGEDLGELATELENLKSLAETVGESFKQINEGLSDMGIASGKYKTKMDELNSAFQEGTITQEEYVSEIQKLADEVTLLAEKHGKVTEAIKETGLASVSLQEQLNELDQSFVDGEMTQQEYIQALEKLGDKAHGVADAYSVIREAIEKVGQPAEILREQFEALAKSLNNGVISEKEFAAGLDELGSKAETLVNAMDGFDSVMEKINGAFVGTNIGIGQAFTAEMDTLKTALANGEISLDEFINKVNNLSTEAQGFYATFESVKNTLSSGLSGAIKSFITFEFDDSMMGELQAYVERVKGHVYESSEEFSKAFADMGKEGQQALINEFKYDQFKQSLDASLKQAILDSLMEALMMEGAIQRQLQQLSAFIAAAMKDGLSQGEMDAIAQMMGDMKDVAAEMAGIVAETWDGVGGEIQTSGEEIEQIIADTLGGVEAIGEEAAEAVKGSGEAVVESAKDAVDGVSETVKNEVEETIDTATKGLEELPEKAKETATEAGEAVADGVKEGTEEVKRTMQETLESLSTTIENLNTLLSEGIGNLDTGNLQEGFDGLSDGLKAETEEMKVQLQDLPEETEGMKARIVDSMAEVPKHVTEKTLEAKELMLNGLIEIPDVIESVIQGVAVAMDALNAQLGISTDNSGQIEQLGQFVAENSQMIMDFKNTVLTTVNGVIEEAQQLTLDAIMGNVNTFAGLLIEQARIMFQEEIAITQQTLSEILMIHTQNHLKFVQEAQLKKEEYLQKTEIQINQMRERMMKLGQQYFQALQQFVTNATNAMVTTTQNAANQIQGIVSQVTSAVAAAASAAKAAVADAKASMKSLEGSKAKQEELKGFASGGFIQEEGLAYLHSGEMVVPRIAVGKVFGQDMPAPSWTKNNTTNSNQTNVSIGNGAIQVSGTDGMSKEDIAAAVLEELERRLANEIHRHSEVMPY